jgi:hypothetical protein
MDSAFSANSRDFWKESELTLVMVLWTTLSLSAAELTRK